MVDSSSFVIRSHKHQYLSQAYTHRQLLSRVYGLVDQRTLDGYARWRKSPLPPCHVGATLAVAQSMLEKIPCPLHDMYAVAQLAPTSVASPVIILSSCLSSFAHPVSS